MRKPIWTDDLNLTLLTVTFGLILISLTGIGVKYAPLYIFLEMSIMSVFVINLVFHYLPNKKVIGKDSIVKFDIGKIIKK